MDRVIQWAVAVISARGTIAIRRCYVIKEHGNGRAHISLVGADGAYAGSTDIPASSVYPTRELAIAAAAEAIEHWTGAPNGPPPPCEYCERERLLSTNLRLDVLRAAGMPPAEVERAKASMERGEW